MSRRPKRAETKARKQGRGKQTSIKKSKETDQRKDKAANSRPRNERKQAEEFAEVAQRIETLTQVLRCLRKHGPPQRFDNTQIHDLLRHFAVLLTCGQKGDIDAKRVTAVTGRLTEEGRTHTMAITQNPFSTKSSVSRLGVDQVIKTNKGFEEVINGDRDAESLSVHIGDLWAAFASCDPAKDPQAPAKLLNFVISRSFRKLRARLQFGEWRCKERLSNKIRQWQPAGSNINLRWVNVPLWLKECVSQFPLVMMKHRVRMGENGREVLQWEFSDETRKLWATVLATMLSELRQAVEKAHRIRTRSHSRARPSKEERDAISNVSLWSYNLFSYIYWEEGIVQALLTETDLADAMLGNSSVKLTGGANEAGLRGVKDEDYECISCNFQTASSLLDGELSNARENCRGTDDLRKAEPASLQVIENRGCNDQILQYLQTRIVRSVAAIKQFWKGLYKLPPTEPDLVGALRTSPAKVNKSKDNIAEEEVNRRSQGEENHERASSKDGDKQTLETANPTESMLTDDIIEEMDDIDEGIEIEIHLQGQSDGGPGDQLLRYLQALVAWPGAVNSLLADEFHALLNDDLSVGLVKVQPCKSPPCSAKQMMNEYDVTQIFKVGGSNASGSQDADNRNLRLQLERTFNKYCSPPLYKTVHAEATLMGLVSYLASSDDARVNYGEPIPKDSLQILRDVIDPDATEIGIAVGKDCCWCCNRLAYHLSAHLKKNFKLPGTHGVVYGWKPPSVGIPVSVLKLLEDDLWVELVEALHVPPRPRGFRQDSGWSI
ncbi:hypothetical protein V8B97DRAFT_230318 [Scleroderma yunnanense]